MGNTNQVIIGNGGAALNAVKAIREIDRCCPITMISAESCNAYSPVLLTYYLKGRIPREGLFIADNDYYEMMGVKVIFGSKVVAVDPLRQKLDLADGRTVEYSNLLIATGATPITVIASEDGPSNVFTLRTIEDADRILNHTKMAKEVVVIGAGLIGLQVSDALFREGVKLTIMEWSKQVLPENIDSDCAAFLQKKIESFGISLCLEKRVKGVEKRGEKVIIISDSGEELPADIVIAGIGLRPNIQLVQHSGIVVNKGILVDECMRTNIDNIFAAGDVTEGKNLITGKKEVLPTWPNACRQGRIAGLNMAGCEQRYEGGLNEITTTVFGLTIAAVGMLKISEDKGVEELKFSDPDRMIYRKVLLSHNRVVGAVLLTRAGDVGVMANLIRNRRDILYMKREITRTPVDIRMLLPISNYS